MGAARAECRPSRFCGRRDGAIIQLSCPSMIHINLGLTRHRTAGHYKSTIMRKSSPLVPRIRPTTLPFGAASFHPPLALMPFEKTEGFCPNCHEDNHSSKHCRHSFINASGCLNPKLGHLGDNDAYRRWQARMTCYCRVSRSFRPNSHKTNRRHHSGQS